MQNNPSDRRKYQRVALNSADQSLQVSIVDHGACAIFDMSYEGAALSQPSTQVNQVDQALTVHLKTAVDEAKIPAVAVRVSQDVVAVNFKSIDVSARVIIDRMVTDRIVGLNMNLIDPRHYSQQAAFTHWFHGPKDTNLYLWTQTGKLIKAHMEMSEASMIIDEDMMLFENRNLMAGIPRLNNMQIAHKALAIISQIDSDLPSLKDLVQNLENHVQA